MKSLTHDKTLALHFDLPASQPVLAWYTGFAAGFTGSAAKMNPFRLADPSYMQWLDGWVFSQELIAAKHDLPDPVVRQNYRIPRPLGHAV